MHWRTLAKILKHSEPPGFRQGKARGRPKLGAYLERIEEILEQDASMPRKQRHTAKRIWDQLKEWRYTCGYTVVKEVVRELGNLTAGLLGTESTEARQMENQIRWIAIVAAGIAFLLMFLAKPMRCWMAGIE